MKKTFKNSMLTSKGDIKKRLFEIFKKALLICFKSQEFNSSIQQLILYSFLRNQRYQLFQQQLKIVEQLQ